MAFTVHSSSSIEAPRFRRIVLRAVATTKASSATMNDATAVSASTHVLVAVSLTAFKIVSFPPQVQRLLRGSEIATCLGKRTRSLPAKESLGPHLCIAPLGLFSREIVERSF